MIQLSGPVARSLDLVHSMIYFAPEANAAYAAAGVESGRMGYFASRAAPMGAVGPGVVTATFYNFNPALVARTIPQAWDLVSPAALIQARFQAAEAALRRLLGPLADAAEIGEAAELAGFAARSIQEQADQIVGRPLFGGHCDVPWPGSPLGKLWHATALLREHRGDGHIIALMAAGLSGLESLITHVATGRGFAVRSAQRSRGWSVEEWEGAQSGLLQKGLLDIDGGLTPAGVELRTGIEAMTDRLSIAPWVALGESGTVRLRELGKQLTRALVAAGAVPDGIFAAAKSPNAPT